MDEYRQSEDQLPDSIQGYVVDVMSETEVFHAGVKTTSGRLTHTVWLVVTSEQLVVVISKLLDATLLTVPLINITEIQTSRVDLPAERRRRIQIETIDDTLSYELHDPERKFIEAARTAVAAVPDPELANPTYPTDIDHAIQNCERVVDGAASARRDGSLAEANDRYKTAITGYRTILERLPFADDRRDTIEKTLTDLQETQQRIANVQECRDTLQSRLTAAENSFQTAVRAHLEQQQTVARIRYREARDNFENALESIITDVPVFVTPIEVVLEASDLAVTGSLSEFSVLSTATATTLQQNGISSVADLQTHTVDPTTDSEGLGSCRPIRDHLDSMDIEQSHASILLALAWQHAGGITFTSRNDIQQRLQQAITGYKTTV